MKFGHINQHEHGGERRAFFLIPESAVSARNADEGINFSLEQFLKVVNMQRCAKLAWIVFRFLHTCSGAWK